MTCPKCNKGNIKEESIVKLVRDQYIEIIGTNYYCDNMNCNYEKEVLGVRHES